MSGKTLRSFVCQLLLFALRRLRLRSKHVLHIAPTSSSLLQNYIESEVDVSKEEYTFVFNDESLYFCVPEKICTITFIVYSASDYPDKEILSFAINSINEKQIYLPKNQMRENYHYSNKDVFYYTNVSKNNFSTRIGDNYNGKHSRNLW